MKHHFLLHRFLKMIARNGFITLLLASVTVQGLYHKSNTSSEASEVVVSVHELQNSSELMEYQPIETVVLELQNEADQSLDSGEIDYRPIDAEEVDRDAVAPSTVKQIHVVSQLWLL